MLINRIMNFIPASCLLYKTRGKVELISFHNSVCASDIDSSKLYHHYHRQDLEEGDMFLGSEILKDRDWRELRKLAHFEKDCNFSDEVDSDCRIFRRLNHRLVCRSPNTQMGNWGYHLIFGIL